MAVGEIRHGDRVVHHKYFAAPAQMARMQKTRKSTSSTVSGTVNYETLLCLNDFKSFSACSLCRIKTP